MRLSGKVVLITGGRRVGSDLALLLADRGSTVAMTYYSSRETIEQTVAMVESRGARGLAIPADLRLAEQAGAAVSQVVATFGRLDVLVNMASIYRRTPFATLTPADFDAMIASNLAAPYHTAIAAARQMQTQEADDGVKGKIINVGDWATHRPYRDYLPYLVGKGALTTFTLGLARELAPDIAVNVVEPAMIEPPPNFSEADRAAVIAQTPLHRSGTPDDLNRLILYLLEGTDFATGSTYRVDGGRFLGIGE